MGGGPAVRDLLGRTVCIYTASADAYRTTKQGISIVNVELKLKVPTYTSPIKHEVPSLAFAETPKYRQAATNGHESKKVEESDRCFGDNRIVRRGHQQPFIRDRWFPQG